MSQTNNLIIGWKSLEEMLPVERLVWLNRWAKVKDFHKEDTDLLYSVKDKKILEMVESGTMAATKVVVRQSPAPIQKMRVAIANKGADLTLLNSDCSMHDILNDDEYQHFRLLDGMADFDFGFDLDYSEEVYQSMIAPLLAEIEAYKKAKATYDAELEIQKPILQQYSKDCADWHELKKQAAIVWARQNKVKMKFPNINKQPTKKSLQWLENQGFKFDIPKPVKPVTLTSLISPTHPKIPSRQYKVYFKTYIPGSIQQVEDAITWAREYCEVPDDYTNIDDDFICFDLEVAIRDCHLEKQINFALGIFELVSRGELKNPKDIWMLLTNIDLDFEEAIGMRCFTDYRNNYENRHADYNMWHQINLSITGYHLIEFQSQEIPEIIFHAPYDRVATWDVPILINLLPQVEDCSKMGREIRSEEKEVYPLADLLPYFGLSVFDFPYSLETRNYSSNRDYYGGDDDYGDDFDDDDFDLFS